ncbi:MAG: bifunctional (p)ppGpp synthetase/guanosine-3',5'-bis(diphosphate) 3'-pyrophosphohydrolase [Alphaproteobacteria bacterium]|nr:bifunctional (p)ppGpp synthetase/guanosine-3',5'-bis(diphosphate) 3'-pyrophosphohydrolase [Alphaproteobacteria bacterium]
MTQIPFKNSANTDQKNNTIQGLIEKIRSYNSGFDASLLQKAYDFAESHHKEQKRASGDPYISHPLSVAFMLADLKLDLSSIIAGLLHDTVEDTVATLEDVEKIFGSEVAFLVSSVTKLSKINFQTKSHAQAENLRKLVIAMAQDIRVLIVKLMDRLHNMETLHFLPSEESRRHVAFETLEIYAPLAQRIGMSGVQEKLQNLAFAVIHPESYQSIVARLEEFHEKGKDIVQSVVENLQSILKEGGLAAYVYGREKKSYSIWRKIQRKNINFDELSDLFGFRIIVEAKADCYQALGLIHHAKVVIPNTFKDYISTPKANHYQSLHTKVLGPHGTRIEIQIRTKYMEEVAERGVAAHWHYKQGAPAHDVKKYQWLQGLLDILEKTSGAEEFLEQTKLEMFQDQVLCFTPKGDMISLPRGATVIDFAYNVHSEVGNKCTGAYVNGHVVPLKTELQTGDSVQIITGQNYQPSSDWEQYAISGKAQANIRRFLRMQKRLQFKALGQQIYTKELEESEKQTYVKSESRVLKYFSLHSFDDLLAFLGEGRVSIAEVKNVIQNAQLLTRPLPKDDEYLNSPKKEMGAVQGPFSEMPIHYAGCCHPIPGDKIIGVVVQGKGLVVHRHQCDLFKSKQEENGKALDIHWGKTENLFFSGRLLVSLKNTIGALGDVVTLVAKEKVELVNIRVLKRYKDSFDIMMDLQVKDKEHIERLMGLLRFLFSVQSVQRM